jgi:GntP family gluconate:H+ symporter
MPPTHQPIFLLGCVLLAVVCLILLIARCKIPAFIALPLVSLGVGLTAGMDAGSIVKAFQEGVGAMLSSVAVVVGLGIVLGKLLEHSGGAAVIARTFIRTFGPQRLHWTLMLVGFVVGIPVFFTVGLVLLVPILFTIVQESKRPLLFLAVPMVAGLSVAHGLVPPHPGPMAAVAALGADPGKTLALALAIGLLAAVLSGPLLGRILANRVQLASTSATAITAEPASRKAAPPSFGIALFTILLPVLLMLAATVADLVLPSRATVRSWIDLAGSPIAAMLIATLFAFYSFGTARGFTRSELLKFSETSLAPAAGILLVVGAGGGFNRVLVASGVGDAMATVAQSVQLSPLLLGWLVAALIRIATGSATVAITTAAGIVAPFAAKLPGTNLELLVIATGAGSLILSHLNDGGFWFVKEYLGLTVPQTLQTWTVVETTIAVVVLLLVLLADRL